MALKQSTVKPAKSVKAKQVPSDDDDVAEDQEKDEDQEGKTDEVDAKEAGANAVCDPTSICSR